jgi:hypothetical protein
VTRLLAAAVFASFITTMVVIAISSAGSGGGGGTTTTLTTASTPTVTTATTTATTPRGPSTVGLAGVSAYDPEGDGHENDAEALLATDGDRATFWGTEHYTHGFGKSGVGLVLDAGRRRRLSRVVVETDNPGFTAEIRIGRNEGGPFHRVSLNRALAATTTFRLRKGTAGRYVVVWVTSVPTASGEAHINEVRAVGPPAG